MSESGNIGAWLTSLELGQYAPVFVRSAIDFEVLRELSDGDLKDLGIPLGHRKKLLKAIADLNGRHSAAAPAAQRVPAGLPTREFVSAGAERRQLTVMFCDLVGSTGLAEHLDPEELRDLMQAYQRACGEVVARYDGHVAQYLGDGLMIYFGWPVAHEDDPARAIRAGLEVVETVSKLKASTPICARVGIHTGVVVVGETGHGDASVPKAAVGNTPNIAARLQALAEPSCVVVSERTGSLARGLFDYTDLGVHALKGVAEPVRLLRVDAARAIESRFEAARGGAALTPLVGREEEVALLLHRWRQARDGEGQLVLVGGEPGVGKSRLTQVLREQIIGESYTALRYQCSPYHLNSALYPIIEQLERAAGFAREDGPEQKLDKMEAALAGSPEQRAESAPLLAAMLALPTERYPPFKLSPQKRKDQTLAALVRQLEARCQRQPLLMVLEDAHWIDPTSQELLDIVARRLPALPILLVITYRPEYTPHWAEQTHVTALGLSRLERRQAAELVANLTGGKPLPQEVLDQILARTDGVPLFIEELTKSVLESRLLREESSRYTLQAPLPALAIPTTLRDSLIARLDRLGPVREQAQIGACIGREFSYKLLAALSPLGGGQLEEALEQLTRTGLVFRRGTAPDASYTFKHALVQDAAYESLLKSKRAQLHAQIAQALEEDFFDQVENAPELLAHHYTQAGNPAVAVPLWRKAGELAWARVALQEAVGHFQKGLALLELLPSSSERDRLELSIREPLNGTWTALRGWAAPEVAANAEAILELAEGQGTPRSLLIGLSGMYVGALTQGRIAESLEWARRMLAQRNQAQDIDLQISGHFAAMHSHFWLGQLFEAREQGNRVLALYDPQRAGRWMQLSGHDLRTGVGVYSAHQTWMLGYPDLAVQVSEEKDAHARRLGHAFDLGWAMTVGADIFDYRREPERLLERAMEAERLAREQSIPFLSHVLVPQRVGLARLRSGQLSEAISLLRRANENWVNLGGHIAIPYLKSALAEALALRGDLDAGLQLIDECVEQIERPGWQERVHLPEVLRLKGWMLMRQGRGEEAEARLRASIDWARQQQAKSWELRSSTTLAQLLAERGQRDAARELLAPVYNWFTEGFDTQDLREAKALLQELE
ncbi:MAG TPA: AAA family ATPase [Burkholderiales bacterium]|nr:AAA family ATPase [Burkholderiales bacterium]